MPAVQVDCKVTARKTLTPTVFEISFELSQEAPFVSGQFASVVVPGAGPGGRDLRRAYSIASAPQARPLQLCVKLVEAGPGTNYLHKLKVGDAFKVVLPYGDFVYKTAPTRRAFFIATGTGIAPFRSMVFSEAFQKAPPVSAHCILGVNNEDELLYCDEFEKRMGTHWITAVSKPKTSTYKGFRGRVTDYLRTLDETFPWTETEFYLCGNGAMIDEVRSILDERGVSKECIHQEVYYKVPKATSAGANP